MYIHELPDWPRFRWDERKLAPQLGAARYRQGRLIERMESLGFKMREEAALASLTSEAVKTSEIEGEMLPADQVRSSIAKKLGMDIGGAIPADRKVEGVVDMLLNATRNYAAPLTPARLFAWHRGLFQGRADILVGGWRDDAKGPMRVVSGGYGNERVHYEAPEAPRLAAEMTAFLDWDMNERALDPVIKAALAHLWFVAIHPFEDGNGRIARAIADRQLAISEGSPQRFYSMSAQIRVERKDYYAILEQTQRETLEITDWLLWFLGCLDRAFTGAESSMGVVLVKEKFWKRRSGATINDRQRLMLNKLLDGFEGKLTSSKWAKIAKCSQDTASRDIDGLIEQGILVKDAAGGRSTSYSLVPV